jgi:hypothetical protein
MIRPAVAAGEKLVTDKFNPLTVEDNKFPITSYFSQVFIALLSGLPLEQRLGLIKKSIAQEQGWKFSYSGGAVSLLDMIKLTLYQDLKTDLDTQNKLMFNHKGKFRFFFFLTESLSCDVDNNHTLTHTHPHMHMNTHSLLSLFPLSYVVFPLALVELIQKTENQTPEINKLIWYCEHRIKSSCFSVNLFGAKHAMGKKVNKGM